MGVAPTDIAALTRRDIETGSVPLAGPFKLVNLFAS
jgi:hypothetical protein